MNPDPEEESKANPNPEPEAEVTAGSASPAQPEESVPASEDPEPAAALQNEGPSGGFSMKMQEPAPEAAEAGKASEQSEAEMEREIEREMRRWNWGAFFLSWIWGLGNRTYIALLVFIPFIGVFIPFVLGFKGNRWALGNKSWNDLAHFRRVQRRWAAWGTGLFIFVMASIAAVVFTGFMAITSLLEKAEPMQRALIAVNTDPQSTALLGAPVTRGRKIDGNLNVSQDSGFVDVTFSVKGPKRSGKLYVKGFRELGKWNYDYVRLEADGKRVDLLPAVLQSGQSLPKVKYAAKRESGSTEEKFQTPSDSQGQGSSRAGSLRTLRLKNGNTIEGIIKRETSDGIVLEIPDAGEISFARSEISSIE